MLPQLYKELQVLTAVKNQPCISVILPFNPKMISEPHLNTLLKNAFKQVKEEIDKTYSGTTYKELPDKLQETINHLDYTTHKKSIAIYISSDVEKVFYLDIEVKEKVLVDTSFEIRDIVLNKKDEHKFLLLVITGRKEKIYAGNGDKLQLMVSNNIAHIQRDLPEQVGNFTDATTIKETRLKKFLLDIEQKLPQILNHYPLPLFVMAPKKTMGYFQKITKHNNNITGFAHGNFEHATESELIKALEPQLNDWHIIKEKHLMNYLKIAEDNLNLTTGIHDVWLRSTRKHKQLLIVEKDFYCPAFVTGKGETIFCSSNNDNTIVTKDAVDDIIEKVLENGGDVEFVDELKDYNRIALTDYYHSN